MGWRGKVYVGKDRRIPDAAEHLFFVLTSADTDDKKLVLVGMTSLKDRDALPCILDPDDEDCQQIREYLVIRSTVAYWDVHTPTVAELCDGIGPALKFLTIVPESLIQRIEDGLLAMHEHVNPIAIKLIKEDRGS